VQVLPRELQLPVLLELLRLRRRRLQQHLQQRRPQLPLRPAQQVQATRLLPRPSFSLL
jgi:hypothetical protein